MHTYQKVGLRCISDWELLIKFKGVIFFLRLLEWASSIPSNEVDNHYFKLEAFIFMLAHLFASEWGPEHELAYTVTSAGDAVPPAAAATTASPAASCSPGSCGSCRSTERCAHALPQPNPKQSLRLLQPHAALGSLRSRWWCRQWRLCSWEKVVLTVLHPSQVRYTLLQLPRSYVPLSTQKEAEGGSCARTYTSLYLYTINLCIHKHPPYIHLLSHDKIAISFFSFPHLLRHTYGLLILLQLACAPLSDSYCLHYSILFPPPLSI